MEPIPASNRTSIAVSTRSAPTGPAHTPTTPLTSLYVVSGLPKSPNTWTLSDPDSVLGLHHSEGAVARWWRPEVLGSTVSPGAGGKKGLSKKRSTEMLKGAGALSKQEVAKMLSKALKVCSLILLSLHGPLPRFLALVHSGSRNHCIHLAARVNSSYIHLQPPCIIHSYCRSWWHDALLCLQHGLERSHK